jgi:hypothetical protein
MSKECRHPELAQFLGRVKEARPLTLDPAHCELLDTTGTDA